MAGFYPPPPTFVGGAQPFADRLGNPQSGPLPDSPPLRGALAAANLAIILAAWTPQPQLPALQQKIASLIPAVVQSGPPVQSSVNLRLIIDQWQPAPYWLFGPEGIAAIQAPAPVQPPPPSLATLYGILGQWQPAFPPVQGYADIAPVATAVDNPPKTSGVIQRLIRESWNPPAYAIPEAGTLAPLIPAQAAATPPPPMSWVTARLILDAWTPPFIAAQGYGDIAPLLPAPAPDSPPAQGGAALRLILESWRSAFVLPPTAADFVSVVAGPVSDAPPPASTANLRLILEQWQPVWRPLPQAAHNIWQQIIAPPPPSNAALRLILDQWRSAPYEIPSAGDLAPLLPASIAPDNPPPSSGVTLALIGRQWQPMPWWPLPSLTLQPQSAPQPLPSDARDRFIAARESGIFYAHVARVTYKVH